MIQMCYLMFWIIMIHSHRQPMLSIQELEMMQNNPTICQEKCIVPTPISNSELQEYKSYTHLSFAAYCEKDLYTWNDCEYCQSQEFLKNTTDTEYFSTRHKTAFGYMGVSHDLKSVFIVFRGALTKNQWIRSIRTRLVHPKDMNVSQEVKLHWGFYHSWIESKSSIYEPFRNRIQEYPNYHVILIGHSYGGALASIMALDILSGSFPFINPKTITLATIGSPRVGNAAFARLINEAGFKKVVRIIHSNDLVPHLYPTWGKKSAYVHYKGETWLSPFQQKWLSCDDPHSHIVQESPYCSNSLPFTKYSIESHMKYTTWGKRASDIEKGHFCESRNIQFLTVST